MTAKELLEETNYVIEGEALAFFARHCYRQSQNTGLKGETCIDYKKLGDKIVAIMNLRGDLRGDADAKRN